MDTTCLSSGDSHGEVDVSIAVECSWTGPDLTLKPRTATYGEVAGGCWEGAGEMAWGRVREGER